MPVQSALAGSTLNACDHARVKPERREDLFFGSCGRQFAEMCDRGQSVLYCSSLYSLIIVPGLFPGGNIQCVSVLINFTSVSLEIFFLIAEADMF